MRNKKFIFAIVSSLSVAFTLIGCASKDDSVSKSEVSVAKFQPKFPEPSSWSFPGVIESARTISPKNAEGRAFNQYGLAYSNAELARLPLATMPAEKLKNYADIVTYAYPDAVFRQAPASCKSMPLSELNETAIANIAYVSLHAVDTDTRKKAAICLTEIQVRLR